MGRCSAPAAEAPEKVTTERPTAAVVTAMRDLARLETAEFHVERVIDLTETQKRFFGLVEARDALLLVAAGDVTAGVDLAELRSEDVVIDKERGAIAITIPPAIVLATRLDNEHTYVHTRRTDLLAERRESLESEARVRAEQTLTELARDRQILARAEKNAVKAVEALARSFGYAEVHVRIRENLREK